MGGDVEGIQAWMDKKRDEEGVSGYRFLATCPDRELYSRVKENMPMLMFGVAYSYFYIRTFMLLLSGQQYKVVPFLTNFLFQLVIIVGLFWMWRLKRAGGKEVLYPATIYRSDGSKTGEVLVISQRTPLPISYLDNVIAELERILKIEKPAEKKEGGVVG